MITDDIHTLLGFVCVAGYYLNYNCSIIVTLRYVIPVV